MIYGLIGQSLRHSYSPLLHQALGNQAYRLIQLEPGELPAFLRRPDLGGLNVTIPYKQTVMAYCSRLSPEAAAIGSVNTLVREKDGSLVGYNTDAYGLLYLISRSGLSFAGRKVLIFGSGGAALTARAVAAELGAGQVVTISRRGENNYENLSRHEDAELLINATPLGMYPHNGQMAADPALFKGCRGVVDLVYNPLRTAFLLRAEALGLPYAGGLAMLAAQAKAAAALFFDRPLPETENERLLRLLRRETENLVLIGMPGSGKSAVGQALARISNRRALDIDGAVAQKTGKTVEGIFKSDGEEEFRRLEREAIAAAGAESGVVIITGGGAVKDERNYAPLHQNGRIYHIERAISQLSREGRPLSLNADLAALYQERLPLYQKFRDAVIVNDSSPELAADLIWRCFNESIGD